MRDTNFPIPYRHDLLLWRIVSLGTTPEAVAREAKTTGTTLSRALSGTCGTYKKIQQIAKVLKLDWGALHDPNLKEPDFHRAVLNGGHSRAGR